MTKISQSKKDLENHLKEQISFLQASSTAYDNGFRGEAKRIAVVIRVLVHDTKHSTSLMTLLGIKDIDFFDSSSDYDPQNLLTFSGLVFIKKFPGGAEYVPKCVLPPKPSNKQSKSIPFEEWWNKVVIVDKHKNKFTRRDLVLSLSNKEGGAHVDLKLDASYIALTRETSLGWHYFIGNLEGDITPIELASMRQISQEVLVTLKSLFPQYF